MNEMEAHQPVKKAKKEDATPLVLTQHDLEEFLKTLISRDVDLFEEFDVVRSIN